MPPTESPAAATDARSVSPDAPLIQTLATLVRVPSVVGCEAPFFRALERELQLHGAEVRAYHGLLEARGTRPHSLTVSAHVDRHGIVCTGPGEYQYAAFVTKSQGDLDGNSVSEQTIGTIADRFAGARVEAYDPWHGAYLDQARVTSTFWCPRRSNLVFELDRFHHVRPGTPIGYLQPVVIGREDVAAQLDNVLSVSLVVDMFRRGFQGTALFTAEEEAGRSWRYLLQWFRRHERTTRRLVVLDTSPYPDSASARAQELVLRRRDAHADFAPELVDELASHCDAAKTSHAFKDEQVAAANAQRAADGLPARSIGRTELGRLVEASGGDLNGATLQLPTTGYHTAQETVSRNSLRAAVAVTDRLIEAGR